MTDFITTKTLDQLPKAVAVSAAALTLIQEPSGPFAAVPIKLLLGRLISTEEATATLAELQALLGYPENAIGLVFADPDATLCGWYRKIDAMNAGSWVLFEPLSASTVAAVTQARDEARNAAADATDAAALATETVENVAGTVREVEPDGEDDVALGLAGEDGTRFVALVSKAGDLLASDPVDRSPTVVVPNIYGPSLDGEDCAAGVFNPATGSLASFMNADGVLISPTLKHGPEVRVLNLDDLPPRNTYLSHTEVAGDPWYASDASPLAWYDAPSHVAILYVEVGQSNSIGTTDSPNDPAEVLIAANPIYPDYALMLTGGVRRSPIFGVTRSQVAVPLVETYWGGQKANGLGETGASGFANHLIRDIHAAVGVYPTVLCIAPSVGGIVYQNVKRGSDVYRDMLNAVEDAVAALRARGFVRIQTIVNRIGHESDGGFIENSRMLMTRQRIVRQYQQAERELTQDIRARTGELQPLFFLNQVHNGAVGPDSWELYHRWGINDCDGVGNLRVAAPMYAANTYSGLHLTYLGHNRQGQAAARAFLGEVSQAGWRPTAITNHWWVSGTRFVLECDMMGHSLVIDTSGDFVDPASASGVDGFEFRDGSASPPAVTAVSVSGRSITIDLAAAPTGLRPQVAYARYGKGLIRDDTAHVSLYDGKASHNWLLSSCIDLNR